MSYPYSDSPMTMGFNSELDLSSLGSFGQVLKGMGGAGTGAGSTAVSVADNSAGGGLSGLMSGFGNIFSSGSLFGSTEASGKQTSGWAMPAINLVSGLLSMQQGKEAQKFAKSQLAESKRQFDMNYGAQRQSINTELEDRQRARVASAGGSGAYEDVNTYLDKNRIK